MWSFCRVETTGRQCEIALILSLGCTEAYRKHCNTLYSNTCNILTPIRTPPVPPTGPPPTGPPQPGCPSILHLMQRTPVQTNVQFGRTTSTKKSCMFSHRWHTEQILAESGSVRFSPVQSGVRTDLVRSQPVSWLSLSLSLQTLM